MNKHIELVKKWLDDKESVTKEELEANADAASYAAYAASYAADAAAHAAYHAAFAADAAFAAFAAADAAEAAADGYVSEAKYLINRYEELTK
tara:strand:- start:3 stop:278 length:276 start_codon:yes stop_codon:yes gene_type:complete